MAELYDQERDFKSIPVSTRDPFDIVPLVLSVVAFIVSIVAIILAAVAM